MTAKKALFLILLLALSLRLIPLASILQDLELKGLYQNDSDEYAGMGSALAGGDITFTSAEASWFPLFRTPGYPIFLAIFYALGLGDVQVALAQILIDAASCLLVFHLALRLSGKENVALLAAALYAVNPLMIEYSFQILSETLFTFAFLLANILFFGVYEKSAIGRKDALMLGALLGFIIWIRPISIVLPIIYAALLYRKHRDAVAAALLLAIPAVFVGLWIARNYLFAGEAVFSATLVWNVVCYYAGAVAQDPASDTSHFGDFISAYLLLTPAYCTALPFSELKAGWDPAISLIISNPLVFIKHSAIGAVSLFEFFGPVHRIAEAMGPMPQPMEFEFAGMENKAYAPLVPFYGIAAAYQLAIYWFAAIFLFRKESRKTPVFWFFIMLLAYTAIINGPISYSRYRIPLEPFLMLFAASTLVEWLWKDKEPGPKGRCRRSPSSRS